LKERIIFVTGPIRGRHVDAGRRPVAVLEADIRRRKSRCTSTRPGGVVTSGLAMYDTISSSRRVSTLCTGRRLPPAPLLLAAGAKTCGFSLPNSRIMVASALRRFPGPGPPTSCLHAQEIQNIKRRLNEIYVKHTGQSYQMIEDTLSAIAS